MSNVPPPPPSSGPPTSVPPPPPPSAPSGPYLPPATSQGVPAWGQPHAQTPTVSMPSGYVAYGQQNHGDVRPSGGLRKATVVLFWLTTAAAGLVAVTLYSRKARWDEYVDSDGSFSDLQRLDDADNLVGLAVVVQFAFYLAGAIVVCLWSRRIALNARARGVPGLKPGLAAGGWFIPVGWFWVGFNQLHKSVAGVHAEAANLRRWQIAFVLMGVSGIALRLVNADFNATDTADDVASTLNTQGSIGLFAFVLFAIAAFFATRATKEVDQAVTGPAA